MEKAKGQTPQPRNRICLYSSTIIVNIMALGTGIAYSWTSPAIPKLNGSVDPEDNPMADEPLSTTGESLIAALLSLGCIFGPFVFGPMSDRFGRKATMLFSSVPMFFHFVICAFADRAWIFYAARIIGGFSLASTFTVIPLYVGEIADTAVRGKAGVGISMFQTLGSLFAYSCGPYLNVKWFSLLCASWPLIFAFLMYFYAPESPYYLLAKQRKTDAHIALSKLRGYGATKNESVLSELNEMDENVRTSFTQKVRMLDLFTGSIGLKRGLRITAFLLVFQQFSGVTVILSYMQSIFDAASSDVSPQLSAILVGTVQIVGCLFTSVLIDKLGRKFLLLVSASVLTIANTSMAAFFYLKENNPSAASQINWLPVSSLVIYVLGYNLGLGPVPWTLMGELFPPNMKAAAATISASVCVLMAFVTTLGFPMVTEYLGMAAGFSIFAGSCLLEIFFVVSLVPETKGKSLNDIQNLLNKENKT